MLIAYVTVGSWLILTTEKPSAFSHRFMYETGYEPIIMQLHHKNEVSLVPINGLEVYSHIAEYEDPYVPTRKCSFENVKVEWTGLANLGSS